MKELSLTKIIVIVNDTIDCDVNVIENIREKKKQIFLRVNCLILPTKINILSLDNSKCLVKKTEISTCTHKKLAIRVHTTCNLLIF